MGLEKYRQLVKRHSTIFENFTYITALQVFVMITPLITYPYLVRVLGKELYGWVITAQVVASYCSILIDFGFKSVSARHVSIFRHDKEKLSEIISTILTLQGILWLCSMAIYVAVVCLIPSYRQHLWLFLFAFGLTFNELLFPQYFFQGIEKMKYITILNIVIRLVFVGLVFLFVKAADDYVFVPLLSAIGYFIGGCLALYVVFKREDLSFKKPSFANMKYYMKDASPIFFTDVICTIKDKLNYILLGACVGMGNVVVYDLGSKFTNVLLKPASIVNTVLFPKIAKERNVRLFKKAATLLVLGVTVLVVVLNLFLPEVVHFFIAEDIDLLPIRLYTLAPILVGLSGYIASNLMIALGYNRYILYSIVITTILYLLLLGSFYWLGYLNSVTSFIVLTVLSYLGELIYRLIITVKIFGYECNRKN